MTPVTTPVITSTFGNRKTNPATGRLERNHNGQDMIDQIGNLSIFECNANGVVISAKFEPSRGNTIRVQIPGAVELYQHLGEMYVKAGDRPAQGQLIGKMGTTGDSTGIHLHYEIQKNGVPVNPAAWSDVPNSEGVHPGNKTLDGVQVINTLDNYIIVGPVSDGDIPHIKAIEELATKAQIPYFAERRELK